MPRLIHYWADMTVLAYSYARFSSAPQARGDSLRRQVENAEAYAAAHGLTLDTQLRDEGISAYVGTHRRKGALAGFVQKAKAGLIPEGSRLLIDSFDRFSREEPTEAVGLLLDLTRLGVVVIFVSSGKVFGKQSSETDLIWAVFESGRSRRESEEKGRKVADARRTGRTLARETLRPTTKTGPHWLTLGADQKWKIIEKRAATVVEVFEMKAAGLGNATIARRMNAAGREKPRSAIWSETTVKEIIANRAVLGEFQPHTRIRRTASGEIIPPPQGERWPSVPDGPPIPGYFPEIVEPGLFERAQAVVRSRQNPNAQPRSRHFRNLLIGQVVCGACGGTVGYHQSFTPPPGQEHRTTGALRCNNINRGACDNRHRLRNRDVERDLMPFLAALSAAQAAIPAQAVAVQALARARLERAALQTRIDALLDALEEGRGVSGRLTEREAEADALDREIARLEREAAIERAQAAAPDWRDRLAEIKVQMETAQGDALYEARAAMSALIAVAVPLGFEFRDGLLFANFNESSPTDRPRLYYGGDGSVIRWEFAAGGPTFDQVKAAV